MVSIGGTRSANQYLAGIVQNSTLRNSSTAAGQCSSGWNTLYNIFKVVSHRDEAASISDISLVHRVIMRVQFGVLHVHLGALQVFLPVDVLDSDELSTETRDRISRTSERTIATCRNAFKEDMCEAKNGTATGPTSHDQTVYVYEAPRSRMGHPSDGQREAHIHMVKLPRVMVDK
ncbi:hypothetical protein L210DRAFT_3502924 [Boletus edulis BED1]|uniref:Uncharacterized protein n=1 Tax=Boletus edulis BED1 TaxID=1328754 RepID=A0AAD4BYB9_BOLED|nr:hypothetical protein L210DRAFT_3502924 [Boletus edulis BED1]